MDQASTLRSMAESAQKSSDDIERHPPLRVLAVTSGKGGVGKTNVVANLGLALQRRKLRVGILDADLGLANMDVLLGLKAQYNVQHVLEGERSLSEVLLDGPGGVTILPASSGVVALTGLEDDQFRVLHRELAEMGRLLDVLLIDTAAGISSNVIHFLRMADDVMVVASPEPTAIVDAYAVMKVMSKDYGSRKFRFLVNMARDEAEAREVYSQLCKVTDRFLDVHITYQGFVCFDARVGQAVRRHKPVLEAFPTCKASRSFERIGQSLAGTFRR